MEAALVDLFYTGPTILEHAATVMAAIPKALRSIQAVGEAFSKAPELARWFPPPGGR